MNPLTNIRQIRSTQIPLTTFNHTATSNLLTMVYKAVLALLPGHLIFYLFILAHCTSPTLHACSSISVFLLAVGRGVFAIAVHSALNAHLIGFHRLLPQVIQMSPPRETVPEHLSRQSNFCHSLDLDSALFVFTALHTWRYAMYLFVYSLWPPWNCKDSDFWFSLHRSQHPSVPCT